MSVDANYPGKIYRITYQGCEKPYYGSTKDPINWRFNHHKTAYKLSNFWTLIKN